MSHFAASAIGLGIVSKFLTSIDDLFWLGYFLSKKNRLKTSIFYILGVTCMQAIGFTLGFLGFLYMGDEKKGEFVIQLVSGTILIIYATYLWTEEQWDCITRCRKIVCGKNDGFVQFDDDEPIEEELEVTEIDLKAGGTETVVEKSITSPSEHAENTELTAHAPQRSDVSAIPLGDDVENENDDLKVEEADDISHMYFVAFFGSLDDCIAFTVLVLKMRDVRVYLMIGGFIATLLIVAVASAFTLSSKVRDCLERFPDYMIFYALAVWMIGDAFIDL